MGTAILSFENGSFRSRLDRSVRYQGGLFTFHANSTDTGGQFALIEVHGQPGSEPPLHVHQNEDEFFYLLEGKLKVRRGKEEVTLETGESALLPRRVPHTFKILSSSARFLVYITPGGFEGYFRDLGLPVDLESTNEAQPAVEVAEMIRVANRYSVTFMP